MSAIPANCSGGTLSRLEIILGFSRPPWPLNMSTVLSVEGTMWAFAGSIGLSFSCMPCWVDEAKTWGFLKLCPPFPKLISRFVQLHNQFTSIVMLKVLHELYKSGASHLELNLLLTCRDQCLLWLWIETLLKRTEISSHINSYVFSIFWVWGCRHWRVTRSYIRHLICTLLMKNIECCLQLIASIAVLEMVQKL